MTPWDLSSDGWSASYSTRYDFAGNVTGTLESHTSPSGETHNVKTDLTLDPRGNVLSERIYADGSLVSETEYDYDESGNMTSDSRKSLEISSNVHNLPMTVSETTGTTVTNTMTYTYLGDGTKVSAMASDPDAGGHTGMRYRSSFVYDVTGTGGQTLQSIAVSTGRLIAVMGSNGAISFESDGFITDHLGNVAAIVNLSAPASTSTANFILEQNDYLPFGSRIALKEQSSNRYRYAGKEEQDIAGMDLGLLDFGARYYDAFVGRWNAIDPLAEKYFGMSPYNYCGNDPVNKVDPDGMEIFIFDNEGNYVETIDNDGDDYIQWNRVDNDGKKYKTRVSFVDSEHDPSNINSSTKLVFVTDENIQGALDLSGATDSSNHGIIKGCLFLLRESDVSNVNGGKLDFAANPDYFLSLYSEGQTLFVTEVGGRVYAQDHHNLGNFIWGASAKCLGVPLPIARAGAHGNSLKDPHYHELDSKDDQDSICYGYEWAKTHK